MYIYVFVFAYHSLIINTKTSLRFHNSTSAPMDDSCFYCRPLLTPTVMSIVFSAFPCHQRKLQLTPSLPRAIVMRLGLHFSYG